MTGFRWHRRRLGPSVAGCEFPEGRRSLVPAGSPEPSAVEILRPEAVVFIRSGSLPNPT